MRSISTELNKGTKMNEIIFPPLEGGGELSFQPIRKQTCNFYVKNTNEPAPLPSSVTVFSFVFRRNVWLPAGENMETAPAESERSPLPNTYVVTTKKTSCQAESPQRLLSGHSNPGHCCFFKSHVECVPKD